MTGHIHSFKTSTSEINQTSKWLTWAKAHQEIVTVTGILIVLISVGIPYYLHNLEQSEKDAMGALNLGQYYLHSPVDSKNGPFKSNTERDQQALQAFQRITTDYAGTHTAKIARFYVAKCQFFLGQYNLAYANFNAANQELKDTPLGEESNIGKILCLEVQNQWDEAIKLYEIFLKENIDSFIIPEIHLRLANAYLKIQDKVKAIQQLKLTAEKYSDSDWGKEATRRLEELKS